GFLLATASGQAPVTGAQEGVGTRIGEGDAPEGAGQPWVSPTAALAFGLTGRLVGLRAELGPRHQMRVRGESGHVDADRATRGRTSTSELLDRRCGDVGRAVVPGV